VIERVALGKSGVKSTESEEKGCARAYNMNNVNGNGGKCRSQPHGECKREIESKGEKRLESS